MEKELTLREVVEARKQEMESVLPGFVTMVTKGNKSVDVYSPSVSQRSKYKTTD